MYESFTPLTPPGATPVAPTPALEQYAPAPAPTMPVTPPEPTTPTSKGSNTRRAVGPGFVFGAVLASALLASGGTYVAISASTHNPTTPAVLPAGTVASTGNAAGSTSVVDIVKAVSPAVVTIVADGISSTDPQTGQTQQATATGSGVIFDANGLILTN